MGTGLVSATAGYCKVRLAFNLCHDCPLFCSSTVLCRRQLPEVTPGKVSRCKYSIPAKEIDWGSVQCFPEPVSKVRLSTPDAAD